jgi:hypothetical protein
MRKPKFHRILLLTLFIVPALATPALAVVPFRTVALSGQSAPGTGAGVIFGDIYPIVVDDLGRVAFSASLTGNVVATNDTGIWSETAGPLALVAREGSPAPDAGADANFAQFGTVALSGSGQLVFWAALTGTGVTTSTDSGLWADTIGSLTLFTREGSHAPGTPADVSFGHLNPMMSAFFSDLAINRSGRIAFQSFLVGTGITDANDTGIWTDASGSLMLVAREDDSAPGLGPDVRFGGFFNTPINDSGHMAFGATLKGTGVPMGTESSIWSNRSGALAVVDREGDAAPGLPSSVFFGDMGAALFNASSRVAFLSLLQGASVSADNEYSVWSEGSGSLALVARGGDPAPNTDSGVVFQTIYLDGFNDAGHVVFDAQLKQGVGGVTTSNNYGAWSNGLGGLHKVYRRGDQAPGTETGVLFSSIEPPVLSASGRAAFRASFLGGLSVPGRDAGIWMEDGQGGLTLVARKGDTMEVAPGDMRVVSGFDSVAVNAIDQVVFRAFFVGGSSGVFLTIGPDGDGDGVNDSLDNCPNVANADQANADGDGAGDACDGCPNDSAKAEPGICGCGVSDADSDGDGTPDCNDGCPNDVAKLAPGTCGCGVADTDSDGDGTPDCIDGCPNNAERIEPNNCGSCGGACGMGMATMMPLTVAAMALRRRRS